MSSEQARARFDDAYDQALSVEEQLAFEAALTADSELRREYDEFVSIMRATSSLGSASDAGQVNLLPALQRTLREKSGGRFYRDRFSERSGSMLAWLVLSLLVLLIITAYFALDANVALEAPPR